MVRIVVDLTDDEGPLKGDHQLMRLIIEHDTVLKPDDLQTTIAKMKLEKSSKSIDAKTANSGKKSMKSNNESVNEDLIDTRTPRASP